MTYSFIAHFLAGGLLALFFVLRPFHRFQPSTYWLVAWATLFVAGLLNFAQVVHPALWSAAVAIATFHPFLLFAGARLFAERSAPRWLLPAAGIIAVARVTAVGLDRDALMILAFIPISFALELGSGWLVWTQSGRPGLRQRGWRCQLLAILFVGYATFHGWWATGTALRLVGQETLNTVWLGAAVALALAQLYVLVGQARDRDRALVAWNERFADMLERGSDLVAWADVDGRLRYANPALCRLVGWSDSARTRDEPSPRRFFDLLGVDEARRISEQAWPAVLNSGSWRGETWLRRHDGEPVPVSAMMVAECDEHGQVEAVGALLRDLSERLDAETELRRRSEFEHRMAAISTDFVRADWQDIDRALGETLRAIGELAGARRSAVFLAAAEPPGLVLSHEWNTGEVDGRRPQLNAICGQSLPWLYHRLGRGEMAQLGTVDDLPDEAAADRQRLGELCSGPLTVAPLLLSSKLLGALVVEGSSSTPLADEDGWRVQLATNFVTNAVARRHAALLIEQQEADLRQSQKMEAIGQLAGGVAHDFNNLLTVISGYGELLANSARLPAEHHRHVEQINRAAERAGALTSHLLAFSRRQLLAPQSFDLNQRLLELERMLRRTLGEKVRLHLLLAPELPPIYADPSRIDQVVVNLVVNARDAITGDGAIVIATDLVERPRETGAGDARWAKLSVTDDGSGIEPEIQGRIFEPFFTTKEPGKGTGLGLSTVYGVLQQSGGSVHVDSRVGVGTTVEICLPLAQTTSAADTAPPPADHQAGAAALTSEVLLVEDEPRVRALTRMILESAGCNVLEAEDGMEALRLADETRYAFDLVVTDVVMPRLGGSELVAELRRRRGDVPALFISGYPGRTSDLDTELPANSAFLTKPFTSGRLLTAVRRLLAAQRIASSVPGGV